MNAPKESNVKRFPRAFFSALTLALAGWVATAHAQQIKLNLADPYAPTEVMSKNIQAWGDELSKATNGAVQVTMHWHGSLFKNPDIRRAVQTGQTDLGTQLMQNLGSEKRLFEIDGLPFLTASNEDSYKLWELSKPALSDYLQKQGLRLLFVNFVPPQGFYFKKEVEALADIKGVRMRAYNEMTSRMAQLMGAIPTTVQITELAQAMTTGTVQSYNTAPTSAVVMKAWEFTTHYYDTEAWRPKTMVFMNEKKFSSLPKNVQQAILDSAAVVEKRGWEESQKQTEAARAVLATHGLAARKPSQTFERELAKVGETMRTEWLQKADDDAKAVMANYLKATGR